MEQLSFWSEPEPCRDSSGESSGTKANRSGKVAEDTIYCIFKERGYVVRRQQYIGKSIYGQSMRVDLFIESIPGVFPGGLIIESKWQASSGSADEKLVYLLENIRRRYPAPTIIMLDGGGYRDGAADFLKKQVDGIKLIGVFTFAELMTWIIEKNI